MIINLKTLPRDNYFILQLKFYKKNWRRFSFAIDNYLFSRVKLIKR